MKMKKILAVVLATTTVMASSLTAFATTTTPSSTTSQAVADATPAAPVTSSVAGVKTTVTGAYSATTIAGSAVTTPVADISKAMGLTGNQVPYMIVMDTDQKRSYAAMASITGAVKALGVTMGPVINVNLGIRDGVNFTTVDKNDAVKVSYKVAIPANFQSADATYMVIGVYYGGEIVVYEDKDTVANTVTVEIPAGLGAYAIVRK